MAINITPDWDRDFDPSSRFASIDFGFLGDALEDIGGGFEDLAKDIWNPIEDAWKDVWDELGEAGLQEVATVAIVVAAIYFTGPAGAQWWGTATASAGSGAAAASQGAMLAEQTAVFGAAGSEATAAALASNAGASAATNAGIMAGYESAAAGITGAASGASDASWGVNQRAADGTTAPSGDAVAGDAYAPGNEAPAQTPPSGAGSSAYSQPAGQPVGTTAQGPAYGQATTSAAEEGLLGSMLPDDPLLRFGLLQMGGNFIGGLFEDEPDRVDPDEAARKRRERFEVSPSAYRPVTRDAGYRAEPYNPGNPTLRDRRGMPLSRATADRLIQSGAVRR